MKLSEKCPVCEKSLKYGDVLNLEPCQDKVHKRCYSTSDMPCPKCREPVAEKVDIVRRKYKRHSERDRKMVVQAANNCKDWLNICNVLDVNRNTAESWIKDGRLNPLPKGGNRAKSITTGQSETIVDWLEEDPQLSLKVIRQKLIAELNLRVSVSTISRCLNGLCITVKKVHYEPVNMNNAVNKQKRKEHVEKLQIYNEQGIIHKVLIHLTLVLSDKIM